MSSKCLSQLLYRRCAVRIEFYEIENFKSILSKEKLILNDVTTIIGKNESGKTNLLNCIGMLDFNTNNSKQKFTEPHVSNILEPAKVSIKFSITENERSYLDVKSMTTTLQYNSAKKNIIPDILDGFNQEYFLNEEYIQILDRIEMHLKDDYLKRYKELRKVSFDKMSFEHKTGWLKNINTIKNYSITPESKEEFYGLLEQLKTYIDKLYKLFPKILFYEEYQLRNSYNLNSNHFEKFQDNYGIGLVNLLTVTKISIDYFKHMVLSTKASARKNFADEFQIKIDKFINLPFNEYYSQDDINLVVDLSNNQLRFFVKSNGKNIEFQERSNGLKWYLSLFIALKTNNNDHDNILFLIDEPATSLHVDAQVEIKKLFYQLPSNVQLLYTTHSPFLIDEDKLENIRAVQKNIGENTEIINSIHSSSILGSTNKETLSPILKAIGMSGKYALGIDSSKVNIVTEGIIDAMYLKFMSEHLNYNDQFCFIASVGASQILNIALILEGWDLSYVCLLDSDSEGIRAKSSLEDALIEKVVLIEDVINKPGSIEDILDSNEFIKADAAYSMTNLSKTLIAKNVIRYWKDSPNEIESNTMNNFTKLFEILSEKVEQYLSK